jgi:sulfatase maturation enzyme AslB (radical SAM superfamily)
MNETKPFCMLPWYHQVINPDGGVKPCCVWQGSIKGYDTLNFFSGEFMNGLRDSFKKGIPHSECQYCIYAESTNSTSIRLTGFETAKKLNVDVDGPLTLLSQDVGLSNVCNLKCRMCNQRKSTKWIADEVAMGAKSVGLLESNWALSEEQVKTINRLRFPGGEPLMHQDIICAELTKLKDMNRLQFLDLHFTTNMTVEFTVELINLIAQTSRTTVGCSVDGVSEMNDYIRSDSKWEDVVRNVNTLADINRKYNHVIFGFNPVYNIFNANEFDRLVEWGSAYSTWIIPSMQSRPDFQDARNLPDDYKLEIIDRYNTCKKNYPNFENKFNAVINHLRNNRPMEYNVWKRGFKAHNLFLDMRRHTRLENVNPRLAAILNE